MGAILAIVWTFLKSNWKLVLIGLAIAALVGYIETLRLEVGHYKSKAGELELEISTAKTAQAKETERQVLAFDAQTKKYADSLRAKGNAIMASQTATEKRIKAHEASKHIILTPDVIELFNATVPTARPETVTPTKPEDAGKASASEKSLSAERTLNDLLLVSNENNANHQRCIEQVLEWQQFWEDYARTLRHSD